MHLRFLFLLLSAFVLPFSVFANGPSGRPGAALEIFADVVISANCSSMTGYAHVYATGGVPEYEFEWSDGTEGPELNAVPGIYSVTVTDDNGNTAETTVEIDSDLTPPLASAGSDLTWPCTNTGATLAGSGSAGPGFSYQWLASNGAHIVSGATTLTPVVSQAGTYTLVVTNTANGCTTADALTVTGTLQAPVVTTAGGVLNCYNATVQLTASYSPPHATFVWDGPGPYTSNLLQPTVSAPGNYVLIVNDTTGCSTQSTAVVSQNVVAPTADVTGGGTLTCFAPTAELLASSNVPTATFEWKGPAGYSAFVPNPVVSQGGTYTVTVTNPGNGCTATDAITVNANLATPTATAATASALTCTATSVALLGTTNIPNATWAWTGPGGFTSTLQNPTTTVPGVYTLTVRNLTNGCSSTATATMQQNITPPTLSATGGTKTCAMPNVMLTGSSTTPNAQYLWTGPGSFSTSQQNPSTSVPGAYTLRVTNPANGCTASTVVSVSQNLTPPSLTATAGTVTCTNPNAPLTATTSTPNATFVWSGPNNYTSTQQNPTATAVGYYYVTVTNPVNGCTSSSSAYMFGNNTPPFTHAGPDRSLNCNFASVTVSAMFSATGPNLVYQWTTWNGNILSGATTLMPHVNAEGSYILKITDTGNGCIGMDSMFVTVSPPVTAAITQTQPSTCPGTNNGSTKVVATGGTGSYAYNWSNGSTSSNLSGLPAGTYTVTVADSEGCTTTAVATVPQLTLAATISSTAQTAVGINNGTASISPSGGTTPYTVLWSNGSTIFNMTGLAPGAYSVTVTDASGCTVVRTTNVSAANCVTAGSITSTNPTCGGLNNGSATITMTNGMPPFSYAWSSGAFGASAANLGPGNYSVTATDAAFCTVVLTTQITAPPVMAASITNQINITCPGGTNGSLTVAATGGTTPYTYQWSNNKTTPTNSGLGPGTYSVTVTDNKQCTSVTSSNLASPAPIVVTVSNKNDVACQTLANGSITVAVAGGTAPYTYLWSNGGTGPTIGNLAAGTYTVNVADANGCAQQLTATISITDNIPPTLVLKNAAIDLDNNGQATVSANLFDNGSSDGCGIASLTVTPTSFGCAQVGAHVVTLTATDFNGNSSTGTAQLIVSDNLMPSMSCPFNMTLGSCNPVATFNMPQVQDNCTINPAGLQQVSGLPSGSAFPVGVTLQKFQYTDPSGNIASCQFEITVKAPIELAVSGSPASCSGACDGSAQLTIVGGVPMGPLQWSNGQTGLSITALCPGTYTVTATDNYGCTATITSEITVDDQQAPVVSCPQDIVVPFCNATAQFNNPVATDNCPVNPAGLVQTAGLASGSTFPAGTTVQTFRYTDLAGNFGECSFTVTVSPSFTATVTSQPILCNGQCNGTATAAIDGTAGPFNFLWANGSTDATASNLCAGTYTVTITDPFGCQQTATATLTQPDPLQVQVLQVVAPSGTQNNGSIAIAVSGGTAPYTYGWSRNGAPFAGTQNVLFIPAGQYVVNVTDAHGCVVSSGVINLSATVSAAEPAWAERLALYPNPAHDAVTLSRGETGSELEVNLCQPSGAIVQTHRLGRGAPSLTIDVSSLPAGLYMLRVRSDAGSVVRKLVVVK